MTVAASGDVPVRPSDATHPHSVLVNPVSLGEHALRLAARANLPYLILGEATKAASSASTDVVHVLDVVAEVEVIGAHATRVVALVQNPQPIRDVAMMEHPRHAVRPPHAPIRKADLRVSPPRLVKRAGVRPTAVIGLRDPLPELRDPVLRRALRNV